MIKLLMKSLPLLALSTITQTGNGLEPSLSLGLTLGLLFFKPEDRVVFGKKNLAPTLLSNIHSFTEHVHSAALFTSLGSLWMQQNPCLIGLT